MLGNKSDLVHLSIIDNDSHLKAADEMNMQGYIGSAKTGDKIYQMFFKLAAELAGVKITKA